MLRNLKSFNLPELEEKVLKFWKENRIFKKSLALRKNKKKFVFYEGPPSANARPGLHHVLARSFKDIILRYKTMAGFFVPRRGGWDTHGLPIELGVEKELNLKSKKEIEKFGIAEFNKKCKELVWKYKDEWEKMTERIGFWLDLDNPYVTYENDYIETLWWIFKQIWDKKLLYKGHKIIPWCHRCGTALSSHELALGYKEIEDKSVYVKFKLRKGQKIGKFITDDKTYILSWTTTPWTLPGNAGLAVGENIDYKIAGNSETFIFASALEEKIFPEENLKTISKTKGKSLADLKYEPLFSVKKNQNENSHKIYAGDFVNIEEGTGVVHIAPMYGEDDYQLGLENNLPQFHTVNENGKFTKEVAGLAGLKVKDKATEDKIIRHLKTRNSLLKTEFYVHDYPFCWRCSTPLIYYARNSWFIAMKKLRKDLISENQKINWIPDYIKNGRFGEWLKEAKDWAISRERYWGTPLPIWQCQKCEYTRVIGGLKELEQAQKTSNNKYILMRHAESENNLKHLNNCWPEKKKYHITLKGRLQAEKAARKLKDEKIDLIFSSDITRTKETAKIISGITGIKKVSFDKRLREVNVGIFNGRHSKEYHAYFSSDEEKFVKQPPKGETLAELRSRLLEFLEETGKKHKNKTILIISHEYPLWMMASAMKGLTNEQALKEKHGPDKKDFLKTAEFEEFKFRSVPREETGQADVHKPYLDKISFPCPKCLATRDPARLGRGKMKRISEVADVWFDSGAMPFAQEHYPFSDSKMDFPADYITEGIDQTRGWFYTLLAVAVLLGRKAPYRNVISLGLLLDKNGQKMSKSKGNTVDPWQMIEKYGIDAIRWYFYTINPPGEPKCFNEGDLTKTSRQFLMLAYNSFVFLETYGSKKQLKTKSKPALLDKWILSRMNETILEAGKKLEKYGITEAAKLIEEFTVDLSRWYIRRSRRRFQPARAGGRPETQKDYVVASQTLKSILENLAKILAPFVPFFGEALYKSLGKKESVHLENWPKANKKAIDKKLSTVMAEIRRLAALALAKRAEAGIKVRQPLLGLKISSSELRDEKELLEILADEINVKTIIFDGKIKEDVELNTEITQELREEGILRELNRIVQDLRKESGLKPKDAIRLSIETEDEPEKIFKKRAGEIKREISAKSVEFKLSRKFDAEMETKINGWRIQLEIKKI